MGGLLMRRADGMRAVTRPRHAAVLVLAVLAAVALAACGGTGGRRGEDASPRLLSSIASAMATQGHAAEAAVARSSNARLTPVPSGFAGSWRIYQVDGNRPHPAQFTVGVGPDRVVLLTGDRAAFGRMAKAAGTRVHDAGQAVALAQVYLRTTRPTDVLAYTVDDVGQIRFRPHLSTADAARRDAIVRRYRSVVAAPRARPAPGGYTVTAYAVRDRALQRRTLKIGRAGTVKDRATTLAGDLPVPYTM